MGKDRVASLHSREHDILRFLVRETREAAGISQERLSDSLDRPITYIGKVELGSRRLDLVELDEICAALGTETTAFVAEWKRRLAR